MQEQLELVETDNPEQQATILKKAKALHNENQVLKETLARMKVVQPDMVSDGSTPQMDSEEEELMRMRYFEALRRQQFEDQMR